MLELVSASNWVFVHLAGVIARFVIFFAKLHPGEKIPRLDPRAGLLPQFLIEDSGKEVACWTEQECDDYRRMHNVEFQSDSEFETREEGEDPWVMHRNQ